MKTKIYEWLNGTLKRKIILSMAVLFIGTAGYSTYAAIGIQYKHPSIAMNNSGTILAAWINENGRNRFEYSVDTYGGNVKNLLSNAHTLRKMSLLGGDEPPAVALNNNGTAVVVYADSNKIYYQLGTCIGKPGSEIKWTDKKEIKSQSGGENPTVTINNDGKVVVVDCKVFGANTSADSKLHYIVGQVNSDATSISWGNDKSIDKDIAEGLKPDVDFFNSNLLCLAYESSYDCGNNTRYIIGTLDDNSEVEWGTTELIRGYPYYQFPSVSVNNNGVCLFLNYTYYSSMISVSSRLVYSAGKYSDKNFSINGSGIIGFDDSLPTTEYYSSVAYNDRENYTCLYTNDIGGLTYEQGDAGSTYLHSKSSVKFDNDGNVDNGKNI